MIMGTLTHTTTTMITPTITFMLIHMPTATTILTITGIPTMLRIRMSITTIMHTPTHMAIITGLAGIRICRMRFRGLDW